MDSKTTLTTIEKIAKTYPEESEEYKAICQAARALMFVEGREVAQTFKTYMESVGKELTESQKKHLLSSGIDPEENRES